MDSGCRPREAAPAPFLSRCVAVDPEVDPKAARRFARGAVRHDRVQVLPASLRAGAVEKAASPIGRAARTDIR